MTGQTRAKGGFTIRRASIADIPELVRLRRVLFEAIGFRQTAMLDASDLACEGYFHEMMRTGGFQAWVAVTDEGDVVASGALVIDRHPPSPDNLTGRTAYLMSLSTEPAFRRRGLATRILQAMLSALHVRGIPAAALHATDAGRALYTGFGFRDSHEMRPYLERTAPASSRARPRSFSVGRGPTQLRDCAAPLIPHQAEVGR